MPIRWLVAIAGLSVPFVVLWLLRRANARTAPRRGRAVRETTGKRENALDTSALDRWQNEGGAAA